MATIQQVRKAAAHFGGRISIEYDREAGILDAWSAPGFVFVASGCHTIAHHFERGPWAEGALAQMLEEIEDDGLEPCRDPECDTCNEALGILDRVHFDEDGETLVGEINGEAISDSGEWSIWFVTCLEGPRAGESFRVSKDKARRPI